MDYLEWLLVISAGFFLLERALPERRAQPALRRQLGNDLVYLLFNGHVWGYLKAFWIVGIASTAQGWLERWGWMPDEPLLAGAGFWTQFLVFLVAKDFLEWCVHRVLHGVPWLWQFHKVHHSVHEMDWAANFRFHWMELVVYDSLKWAPLLFLGGDTEPLFAVFVFATFWGHFNHSNLRVELGWLGYVFNSPRMHMWHHDASSEGGVAKNFGIVLSVWDWLFGTAYWPRDRAPERIGYPHDEEMPIDLPRQFVFPAWRRK